VVRNTYLPYIRVSKAKQETLPQVYTDVFRDCSIVLSSSSMAKTWFCMTADSKEAGDCVSLISILDAVKYKSAFLSGITSEA